MNYGKKIDGQEAKFPDLPFLHDGETCEGFFYQSFYSCH